MTAMGGINYAAGTDRMPRLRVLNVDIDPVDCDQAIAMIVSWCELQRTEIVVNPNLDCLVKLEEIPRLREVYGDAALVLADGWPIVAWAKIRGHTISKVPGSDMVIPLCRAAAAADLSVFIFGTTLASLARASRRLVRDVPGLDIAGVYSPPFGFDDLPEEREKAIEAIRSARAPIVLLALGAPKQEIWAHDIRSAIDGAVFVCVGASIDFLSGRATRAPRLFRRLGMEWLWRAVKEPRRLGPRYLRLLLKLPLLILRYGF